MRLKNNYSTSYIGSKNKMQVLKYELSNEYGYNLDGTENKITEEKIFKKTCDHRNNKVEVK